MASKFRKKSHDASEIARVDVSNDFDVIADSASHAFLQDTSKDLFPYFELSRKEHNEPDEHQSAQTYWTEQGTERISLMK